MKRHTPALQTPPPGTDADIRSARAAARSIGRQIMLVSGLVFLGVLGLTIAYVFDQSIPRERIEAAAAASQGSVFVEATDVLTAIVVLGLVGIVFAGIVAATIARRAVQPLGDALRRQRDFVADASHELRTPLAVLDARLQALQRKIRAGTLTADPLVSTDLHRLRGDSQALIDIVGDLLLAAGDETDPLSAPIGVYDVAAEALTSLCILADNAEVALHITSSPPARDAAVDVPRTSVRRCVVAVVDNAIAHSPRDTAIRMAITVEHIRKRPHVVVRVSDQGHGISGIDPVRVFERFAHSANPPPAHPDPESSRATRKSFGIGLALVRDITTRHGGTARIAQTSATGTTIEFTFPLATVSSRPSPTMRGR